MFSIPNINQSIQQAATSLPKPPVPVSSFVNLPSPPNTSSPFQFTVVDNNANPPSNLLVVNNPAVTPVMEERRESPGFPSKPTPENPTQSPGLFTPKNIAIGVTGLLLLFGAVKVFSGGSDKKKDGLKGTAKKESQKKITVEI